MAQNGMLWYSAIVNKYGWEAKPAGTIKGNNVTLHVQMLDTQVTYGHNGFGETRDQ